MSEASQNLKAFAKSIDSGKLQRAMAQACKTVQTHARKNAPHDTGNLIRSIDFEVSDGGKTGVVFSNCEYAPYVEYGTGIYATKGGGRKKPWAYEGSHGWTTTKGNKAQPFLEPAVNQSRSDILDAFKEVFNL